MNYNIYFVANPVASLIPLIGGD